ncbi:MAG: HAMP domain-containing sensor histidine kinase [Acidimicrobiia bacterium]|jgi:signal transduction histidine kinase
MARATSPAPGIGAALSSGWIHAALALILGTALAVSVWPQAAEYLAAPVLAIGYGASGWLIYTQSRSSDPTERASWRLIGIGLMSGAVGVVIHSIITLVDRRTAAFGPFDIFFLAAYALVVTGLWRLPHVSPDLASRTRLLLDGLIGSVSIVALLWVNGLDRLVTWESDTPMWNVVIGSMYPALDLAAFVAVMIVVVRRSPFRFDPRLLFLAAAILLQASADIVFLARVHDAASTGSSAFLDIDAPFGLFLLATAGFLMAGSMVDRRPPLREYADRTTPWWTLVAPYSAAATLVVALVVDVTRSSLAGSSQALLYATLLVGVLVIARQSIAIRENRELVEGQRAALVSSISHELRTPLTAMVGFLEVLEDPDAQLGEDERRELMAVVRQQAAYMTRIVTDLVMLARGSIDHMELERGPHDVSAIVLSAVATVDGAADGTDVLIPVPLVVDADADRLQQLVVNLLTNAIRYGNGRRAVRVEGRDGDLVLEVHDDGPGIPKKYELTVWERFERGPHRLNAAIPGSGIGLAVVDAIARNHGGTAGYRRSELLPGSCFTVVVPGAVVPGAALPRRETAAMTRR